MKIEKEEPKAKFQGLLETILDRYYVTGYIEARAMNGLEAEIIGIFNQVALECSSPTSNTTMEAVKAQVEARKEYWINREQIEQDKADECDEEMGLYEEAVERAQALQDEADWFLKLLDAANPARREKEI